MGFVYICTDFSELPNEPTFAGNSTGKWIREYRDMMRGHKISAKNVARTRYCSPVEQPANSSRGSIPIAGMPADALYLYSDKMLYIVW